MPDDPVRFLVQLEGEVDLDTYRSAASALPALLRDIEAGVTGDKPRVAWKVLDEARLGVTAYPNGVSADTIRAIVQQARDGFQRVAEAEGKEVSWPSTFGTTAKNAVKRIVKSLQRVSAITVEVGTDAPLVIRHVKLLEEYGKRSPRLEYGSVEGLLDLVSVRGSLHFSVEDHISGRRISCTIGRSLLQRAKDCLENRVVVEGLLHYDKHGQPTSITDVTSIWPRPDPKRTIEELVGSQPDFTGGVDAADYVRQLREGDDDE